MRTITDVKAELLALAAAQDTPETAARLAEVMHEYADTLRAPKQPQRVCSPQEASNLLTDLRELYRGLPRAHKNAVSDTLQGVQ